MSDAERYRAAWLSAKQGRKNWRELYVKLISKSIRQAPAWWEDCTCGRLAVGLTVTEARNWNPNCPDHGVKSPWYNSEEQIDIRNLRQENSQLWQRLATVTRHDHAHRGQIQELELIRTTLQDDHVTAWERVRELEAELDDLRLAFSELQGAQQPKGKTVDEGKKQASLHEVSELGGDILVAQHKQLKAAVEARAQGATYAELGDALGVTWQAARQRVLKFVAVEGGNGETE